MGGKLRSLTATQISLAVLTAAIFGGAAAVTGISNAAPDWKPSKEQCAAQPQYKNYGQCVSEWAKNKNGYGG